MMRRMRRFFSNWQNWLGLLLVLFFVIVALAAPVISPMDPKTPGPFKRVGRAVDMTPKPPSEESPLGTLPGQYDVLHALVWGTGDALRFGLGVALGTALFGVLFGAIAGYAGGFVNGLMMRIADAFLSFPVIAGVVFLQQLVATTVNALGGHFLFNMTFDDRAVDIFSSLTGVLALLVRVNPLLVSLILFSWMPYARLVNALVITLKRTDFVEAARALGASPFWIIRRHLIPNAATPAVVLAARDVSGAVILQATLTFIHIGGDSTWGSMLATGRNWVIGPGGNLFTFWWVFVPATLAVILFGIGWNLLGDALNDISLPESTTMAAGTTITVLRMAEPAPLRPRPLEWEIEARAEATDIARPLDISGPKPYRQVGFAMDPPPGRSLARAQAALKQGDLSIAIHNYQRLIRQGSLLEYVIRDLNQALVLFPSEASIWVALGDAYLRTGRTREALDAYTKAESWIH